MNLPPAACCLVLPVGVSITLLDGLFFLLFWLLFRLRLLTMGMLRLFIEMWPQLRPSLVVPMSEPMPIGLRGVFFKLQNRILRNSLRKLS